MRHRPKDLDELAAAVAAAAPDDIVEPVPPPPVLSVSRLFDIFGPPDPEGREIEERERDAVRARLRSLPDGFRPMRDMPFADLEPLNGDADGVVVVTDEWRRALVVVFERQDLPEETRELPAWWYRWTLRNALDDEEEISFVPTLWAPLPR